MGIARTIMTREAPKLLAQVQVHPHLHTIDMTSGAHPSDAFGAIGAGRL
jgi:hypothetical protein